VEAAAISQWTINMNVNEESVVAAVDDTLSRPRLALELSMCKEQMVDSSLRAGRLNAMTGAQ
jgi:hypothetical protein